MQTPPDIINPLRELERKVDQNRNDIFELKEEIILNRDEIEYALDLSDNSVHSFLGVNYIENKM